MALPFLGVLPKITDNLVQKRVMVTLAIPITWHHNAKENSSKQREIELERGYENKLTN